MPAPYGFSVFETRQLPSVLLPGDCACIGYVKFIAMLKDLKANLEDAAVPRPSMTEERLTWRASDIEMALFQRSIQWGEERKRAKAVKTLTIAHE